MVLLQLTLEKFFLPVFQHKQSTCRSAYMFVSLLEHLRASFLMSPTFRESVITEQRDFMNHVL